MESLSVGVSPASHKLLQIIFVFPHGPTEHLPEPGSVPAEFFLGGEYFFGYVGYDFVFPLEAVLLDQDFSRTFCSKLTTVVHSYEQLSIGMYYPSIQSSTDIPSSIIHPESMIIYCAVRFQTLSFA